MTPSASTAGGRGDHGPRLSREDIITAIQRWAELFGEAPVTADWNPSVARWRAQEWRIARYRAGDPDTGAPWPSLNAVKRRFDGSFADAVRLAGFEPRRPGPPRAAHSARPAAAPRGDAPPTTAERLAAELDAAHAAVAAAERRAVEAEHRARAAERRIARADAKADAARVRARRAGDRERRAKAARERASVGAREAKLDAAVALRAISAAADARVEQAQDAAADGIAAAHERAARAEAQADRARTLALRTQATDGRRHSPDPVRRRATPAAPAGPAVLAEALMAVTRARGSGDRHGLQIALAQLAAASVGWRDRL